MIVVSSSLNSSVKQKIQEIARELKIECVISSETEINNALHIQRNINTNKYNIAVKLLKRGFLNIEIAYALRDQIKDNSKTKLFILKNFNIETKNN